MSGAAEAALSLALPALQAAATIVILNKQKDLYEDIAKRRIDLIDKAVSNYSSCVSSLSTLYRGAFGRVPDAALFEPVDFDDQVSDAFNANLRGMPDAERLIAAANRLMEKDDLVRMVFLDARYYEHADLVSCQISQLLKGELPVDEVTEVLTDTAEQAALTGRIGNARGMTMRRLGVSRLRAQEAGRASLVRHHTDLNQNVSPIARRARIADYFQTPAQRIGYYLTQNQLIQNSLQNAANLDAAGDPALYAELQVKMQRCNNVLGVEAQRGNLINQFVPNYAAILQPQIQSITDGLFGGDPAEKKSPSVNLNSATAQESIQKEK